MKQGLNGMEMTMKRNDMQRMIIEGVRRLLCGGQPAQEAMGAGSTDHLTGVNRSLEPAQTAFSSGTDGRSSGKKRLFFRHRTSVLSAQNARSLGTERLFSRQGTAVPSGGNFCSLGRKQYFPREETIFPSPEHEFLLPSLRPPFPLGDCNDPWRRVGEWGANGSE